MTFQNRFVPWSLAFAVTAATLFGFASPVLSQDDEETTERQKFEDTIHVIQRKPLLEENRVEVAPRFGMSVNDSIYRSFKVGTNVNYHITERLYVGTLFDWFDFGSALGGTTRAFERGFDQTSTAADAPVVNWAWALEGGYKPIYGKFALFNSQIMYYDIGASLGAGWMNAGSISSGASGTFAGTGSVSARLFFSDWMAFDLKLRDLIFQASLRGGSTIANLVTVSAGISMYFPTSATTSLQNEGENEE